MHSPSRTFTQVMPVAKLLRSRQRVLDQGIREAALRTGTVLADLEDHEHGDRLHGHAMLAKRPDLIPVERG